MDISGSKWIGYPTRSTFIQSISITGFPSTGKHSLTTSDNGASSLKPSLSHTHQVLAISLSKTRYSAPSNTNRCNHVTHELVRASSLEFLNVVESYSLFRRT
jgi:hypothetical protein